MTRERILELLTLVALEMGNNMPAPRHVGTLTVHQVPGGDLIVDAEWAYVKGLAAGAVLQLRDRLRGVA
jgi:hypothetical protein